jgi:hypothetical protein
MESLGIDFQIIGLAACYFVVEIAKAAIKALTKKNKNGYLTEKRYIELTAGLADSIEGKVKGIYALTQAEKDCLREMCDIIHKTDNSGYPLVYTNRESVAKILEIATLNERTLNDIWKKMEGFKT